VAIDSEGGMKVVSCPVVTESDNRSPVKKAVDAVYKVLLAPVRMENSCTWGNCPYDPAGGIKASTKWRKCL
jgi:hypothetical protein